MKDKVSIRLIFLFLSLGNCVSDHPVIGTLINKRILFEYTRNEKLDVYFITNRRENNNEPEFCSNRYLGSELANNLKSGKCRVSVPANHEIGSINTSPDGNDNQFYKMVSGSFYDTNDLFKEIADDKSNELILFIHGFNVNFEEAIIRSAQIKYDLKFPGKILVFSWPAGNESNGLLGKLLLNITYKKNFTNAEQSRIPFASVLTQLKATKKTIHVIVHSMGHQVVLPALAKLGGNAPSIQELVMNAPDFSIRDFKDIKNNLRQTAKRITLYCSPGDNALLASSQINEADRLGSCARFSDIDVINVNPVDDPIMGIGGLGHGYYSSRPILTDLYQLILGVDAPRRLFIRKSDFTDREDFILRK